MIQLKIIMTTKFTDAWDVVKYVVGKKEYLESTSRAFENALFETSLPAYVIDAVASNIMSMKSHCCFRIEDGNFLDGKEFAIMWDADREM